MKNNPVFAHIISLTVCIVWGMTFVATKALLEVFSPVEILVYRFVIGFFMLLLLKPKAMHFLGWRKEISLALAGLTGVTVYFLSENFGLQYTLAANISVIVSVAPMLTAVLAVIFLKTEKLRLNFFLGFVLAIAGIILISYNGSFVLDLNPIGDLLGLFAAVAWAVYSIQMKLIGDWGLDNIQVTRRIFLYGILLTLPVTPFTEFSLNLTRLLDPAVLVSMLYLGLGASALAYVAWNHSIKVLGAVTTSVYIYALPVVTLIGSALVLKEPVSGILLIGVTLAIAGLVLSELKVKRKKKTS